AKAAKVGSYLRRGLLTLAERHPLIGDVRGEGLLLGVELTDEARRPAAGNARKATEAMRERGILLSATGPAGNVLKIRPPLVFQREHADLLLQAPDQVLAASCPRRRAGRLHRYRSIPDGRRSRRALGGAHRMRP